MGKLLDNVEAKEILENNIQEKVKKKSVATDIASNNGSKDKQISAKVNERMYGLFTQVNKGISNNSALNMIISRYVRENKGILKEEEEI